MKIYTEAINTVSKKITITFDGDECKNTQQSVLKNMQAQVELPGFRKGKVPIEILQQRFKTALAEEFQRALFNEAVKYLKDKEGLKIAAVVETDLTALDQGQSLLLEVELEPEFELPDYRSFHIDIPVWNVPESEIDEYIDHLRKQHADYQVVDRPAQSKDYVKLSYEGFVGDQSVDSFENVPHLWCKQRSTWEEVDAGDGLGIPELVKGLPGLKAGDVKDITVKFPKNFQSKALQGKEAVYHVTVEEVREVALPPLDESFFEKNQVKDLVALRNLAGRTLQNRKEQTFASEQKQKISEFLINAVTCELPASWVNRETDIVLQEMVNLFSSHGVKSKMLEDQKSALFEKAQSVARDRIKLNLCFEKIFNQEHLKMEARDIELVLVQEAAMRHMKPEKLLQQVQRDELVRADIQRKAFQAKVINWLYFTLSKQKSTQA